MKAVISSTYDDKYLYFLPIVTWCWNKLGVDVICFLPTPEVKDMGKLLLISNTMAENGMKFQGHYFSSPEDKKATYSQCSRLYGACLNYLEDEILITGDVDMAMFQIPPYIDKITIFGSDLVPDGQFPMCYASGTVKEWRAAMKLRYDTTPPNVPDGMVLHVKSYQQCLDELLGGIECDHFRGNYWGKDQQTLWENTKDNVTLIPRARPNTQFASHRIDRDDSFYKDRLDKDIIDAHLWRPGYTEENFPKILELLQYFYPEDDFNWLKKYTEEYVKLLE